MALRLNVGLAAGLAVWLPSAIAPAQQGPGLAAEYPNDVGLGSDPQVLYFLDFDSEAATLAWADGETGYGWTGDPAHVFGGTGALEIQQTIGTHDPYEIAPAITETDVAFVRWYRMWEPGYDFTQHKMPGVYAKAPDASGAGVPPNGYDKYSCKLFVDFERNPRFYSYNPDQAGIYGDEWLMNLVEPPIKVEAGRWYCFEMMLKANNPPAHDGELKMWIDGALVGHYTDLRFRDTPDLKINEFTYSAYVGGDWTSLRDQKLWDDQIVVATTYIGPLQTEPGAGGAGTGGAGHGGAAAGGGATTGGGNAAGGAAQGGGLGQGALSAGPPGAADDGGCSCRQGRNATAPSSLGVLLALGAAGGGLRRRRKERSA